MNTYLVTMTNGDEATVVADTKSAALAYASRMTTAATRPVMARPLGAEAK